MGFFALLNFLVEKCFLVFLFFFLFFFFLREKVDNKGESSLIGLGLDGPKLGLKLCSP